MQEKLRTYFQRWGPLLFVLGTFFMAASLAFFRTGTTAITFAIASFFVAGLRCLFHVSGLALPEKNE